MFRRIEASRDIGQWRATTFPTTADSRSELLVSKQERHICSCQRWKPVDAGSKQQPVKEWMLAIVKDRFPTHAFDLGKGEGVL